LYIADLLNRNFIKGNNRKKENMSGVIHTISELQIGYMNGKEFKFSEKTRRDEVLTKVQTFCKEK